MMKKTLSGICPILPSPFTDEGKLDCQSLEREVEFLLDAGVSGIALFGNASETFALTEEEKKTIASIVVHDTSGKVPLVFGSGSTGVEPAITNCKWACDNGASVLMIMPPFMIKPDAQRTYEYYARISDSVDIPIMIQDAPNACGVTMTVDTIAKLIRDFSNIQYVKAEAAPTFLKAKKILEATHGNVTVFGGLNGTFFYEELCSGIKGSMPAGEFPDVLIKVYESFIKGNRQEAKEEFYRYLPYIRLGNIPGGMAMSVHKEILKRGGIIDSSYVRNPFIQADETLKELAFDSLEGLPLLALSWKKCTK